MSNNEMVPGRRYRVTKVWEGTAATSNYLTLDNGVSLRTLLDGASAVVTVEEIKPTYIEGRLYRDADGDVVLRAEHTDDSTDDEQPWVFISGRGGDAGERWSARTIREPLVELELKEKQ